MTQQLAEYRLSEMSQFAGVEERTIRNYISLGLLEAPVRRGANTRYSHAQLVRLKAIAALRGLKATIPEIKRQLATKSEAEIEEIAATLVVSGQARGSKEGGQTALSYIQRMRMPADEERRQQALSLDPELLREDDISRVDDIKHLRLHSSSHSRNEDEAEKKMRALTAHSESPKFHYLREAFDEEAGSSLDRAELAPERTAWERVELAPGIELSLRSDVVRQSSGRLPDLMKLVRDFLRRPPDDR